MARKSFITKPFILSFPHLDVPQQPPINPKTGKPEGEPKYSLAAVFPEGTDLTQLRTEILAAATERWGDGAAAKLKAGSLKNPLRENPDDVKEKKYPKGSAFVNMRTSMKPQAVYPWPKPGTNPPQAMEIPDDRVKDVLYPGAMARASVTAFAYDKGVNRGVSLGLNNIQLLDDTTPRLAGRTDAVDEFDAPNDAPAMLPASTSDLEEEANS